MGGMGNSGGMSGGMGGMNAMPGMGSNRTMPDGGSRGHADATLVRVILARRARGGGMMLC